MLGNSISLRSQTGLHLWKTYVSEDIYSVSENIKENIKISAQESLGLHERKQHKPWFDAEMYRIFMQKESG
jgi:hypothetical protein